VERKGIDTAVKDLRNCTAEDISVLFARKYRDNVVGVEGLWDGEGTSTYCGGGRRLQASEGPHVDCDQSPINQFRNNSKPINDNLNPEI
jgi:hypothetical protein